MHKTLFADSGGTGTDWVFLNSSGVKTYFETESYHPSNWSDAFWSRIEQFWKSNHQLLGYTLNFYGAGCLDLNKASVIHDKFASFGFSTIKIQSDLHAAGYAVHKDRVGIVVISGTGSVLFDYSDHQVSNIVGGKGHVLGDEGSGFYFGKLLIEKFKTGSLSPKQISILNEVSKFKNTARLEPRDAKYQWSGLSKVLAAYKSDFEEIHRENIERFIETHLAESCSSKISLVGSYAFHHKELWEQILGGLNFEVNQFVHKPIEHFIE